VNLFALIFIYVTRTFHIFKRQFKILFHFYFCYQYISGLLIALPVGYFFMELFFVKLILVSKLSTIFVGHQQTHF